MQYESSDQIESREVVGPEKPRFSGLPLPIPTTSAAATVPQVVPPQVQPLPTAIPARPGCVAAASAVLFFIAMSSACRFSVALSDGELFGALASFASSMLLLLMAGGLFRTYRWAVNLVLIYSVVRIGEMLGALLIWLSLVNPYMTHPVSKIILLGTGLVLALGLLILPGVVFWWFWRRRRDFGAHPLVENWGRSLYVLAAVIMIAGSASALIDTNNTMPEELESELKQLRQMDAQMYETW